MGFNCKTILHCLLDKQYAFLKLYKYLLHANLGDNYQMSVSSKTGNSEIWICDIIYDTHVLLSPKYRYLVIMTETVHYNSKADTNEIEI